MNLIAFGGSTSKNSINKKLAEFVANKIAPRSYHLLDLNDFEVPIFSVDKEKEGIPEPINRLAKIIDQADLLVISLAEHNGSYSAAFKNTYDWLSRMKDRKPLGAKPVFLMATSPGGRGGAGVLQAAETRFPRDGSELVAIFSLPKFQENFEKLEDKNSVYGIELSKAISTIQKH